MATIDAGGSVLAAVEPAQPISKASMSPVVIQSFDGAMKTFVGGRYGRCNVVNMREALGWTSSLLLLLTIVVQIRKQWTERSGRGVSGFLFVGQTAASLGFTVYSWWVGNWVFTFTNGLMMLSAITGWYVTARFKRAPSQHAHPTPNASPVAASPS